MNDYLQTEHLFIICSRDYVEYQFHHYGQRALFEGNRRVSMKWLQITIIFKYNVSLYLVLSRKA